MVECWLPYGKTEVHVSIPIKNLASLSESASVPLEDPETSVKQSLENPLGGRRLRDIAARQKNASIAIGSDLPSDSLPFVLDALISELREAGLPNNAITIITSPGTTGTPLPYIQERLAPVQQEGINLIHHQWSDTALEQAKVSSSRAVALRKEFLDAELKIAVGEVKPDPFFSFTGSTTTLFPGISGKRPMSTYLTPLLKDIRDGAIQGREVIWTELTNSIKELGIDYAVDTVSDTKGHLIGVFSGDYSASSTAACQFCRTTYGPIEKTKADIAIVSVGGYPYDGSLYRSAYSSAGLHRDLGKPEAIILVAECLEGYGDTGFTEFMKAGLDSQAVARRNRESWTLAGEVARSFRELLEQRNVVLVSMLPEYILKPLGMKGARAVNDALEVLTKNRKGDYRVSVFAQGAYVSARKDLKR